MRRPVERRSVARRPHADSVKALLGLVQAKLNSGALTESLLHPSEKLLLLLEVLLKLQENLQTLLVRTLQISEYFLGHVATPSECVAPRFPRLRAGSAQLRHQGTQLRHPGAQLRLFSG